MNTYLPLIRYQILLDVPAHRREQKRQPPLILRFTLGGGHTRIRKKYNVADDTKYTGGEKRKETEERDKESWGKGVCVRSSFAILKESQNLAEKVISEL